MPTIKVETGKTSEEKKKALIHTLTQETAKTLEKPADHIIVYVQEFPYENIGVGGKTIKEMQSQ